MSGNVPRRRRGQSLLLTPVSDSGEATETTSTVSLRAAANAKKQSRTRENQSQGSSFSVPRSTSSPLIYQRTRAPSGSSSSDILALPRSHSNLVQLQHHFRLLPSQIQPRQPLVQPAFSISGPYSGSDADDDDYDQEEGPPQLLVRRTTSQTRIASPLVPLSMTHRRAPAEPEDDPLTPPRSQTPLNGHINDGKTKNVRMAVDKHPVLIGISGSAIQFNVNMALVTPLLFQCLRTLAVIPAGVETLKLFARVVEPQAPNTSLDYIAAAAWSILTAYQALSFTTGLLMRWRHYYPLTATLIRLVALQAICWPATFYTLRLLQYDGVERPLVCWSVIGTTTCITRSIQMWVTSNIDDWYRDQEGPQYSAHAVASIALGFGEKKVVGGNETEQEDFNRRKGGLISRQQAKSNGNSAKERKWDWNEVVWKCGFPAGVCYFFMAWAMLLSKEMYPCGVSPREGL